MCLMPWMGRGDYAWEGNALAFGISRMTAKSHELGHQLGPFMARPVPGWPIANRLGCNCRVQLRSYLPATVAEQVQWQADRALQARLHLFSMRLTC